MLQLTGTPKSLLLFACVLVLSGHASARAQSSPQRCTIENKPARCGYLSVPENHAEADGRQVRLRTVILPKEENASAQEPIFFLAGGPGQAATDLTQWISNTFRAVRRTRDIVLIDQRGSSGADRLNCERAPQTFSVPADPQRCLTQLSRKAKLELYGTESFIQDLDLARKTLGYDRIVLYGVSYGTRAAFAYARRYPRNLRAVVLVAPAPVSVSFLDTFEEDGRRSLDAIVADCLADKSCAQTFPHLRADVDKARAKLTDPFRVFGLQFLQYSTATAVSIPRILTEAAAGDFTLLDSAVAGFSERLGDQLALGLHLTIVCGEDLPFGDMGRSSPARQQYTLACQGWPAAAVPADFHNPTRIAVPALVLAGEWDPVTSPRWARVAAEQFSPNQVVTLPKAGHFLDDYSACADAMAASFLDHGTADTSCVSNVPKRHYVLK